MDKHVHEHLRARQDVVEQFLYLESDNPQIADRFLDAVDVAYQDLLEYPLSGHSWESERIPLEDVRIGHLRGFPSHLIFYRPVESGIEILRVLHGARDLDSALSDFE